MSICMNSTNKEYIIWVLEEIREQLQISCALFKNLIKKNNLLEELSDNYEWLHSISIEEGVNFIIEKLEKEPKKYSYKDLKCDFVNILALNDMVECISNNLEISYDEAYYLIIDTQIYEWFCEKMLGIVDRDYRGLVKMIFEELNIDVKI